MIELISTYDIILNTYVNMISIKYNRGFMLHFIKIYFSKLFLKTLKHKIYITENDTRTIMNISSTTIKM